MKKFREIIGEAVQRSGKSADKPITGTKVDVKGNKSFDTFVRKTAKGTSMISLRKVN